MVEFKNESLKTLNTSGDGINYSASLMCNFINFIAFHYVLRGKSPSSLQFYDEKERREAFHLIRVSNRLAVRCSPE